MPNAIEYAENELGVHEILAGVINAREDLDTALTVLANARDRKRKLEQDKEDLEMELAIEERGKHAEMSATAMASHLKQVYFQHVKWREYRDNIRQCTDEIDGAELDRKIKTHDIEIGNARMIELGGYLNYLASVKNASVATKRSEA